MGRDDAEAVAGHYDGLDAFYRGVWREALHHGLWLRGNESRNEAAAELVREVGQRLRLAAGERLCDVGCGYGRAMRLLAESVGATAWGVTVSSRQAEQGRAEAGEAVEIVCGDWLENGLPDGGFDALMAIESLSHMVDPARAVREMARVLRPGGRAVLCCWLRLENPRHFEVRHLLDPIRRAGKLPGMGTESSVRRWLGQAGLHCVSAEDFSRQVEPTWPCCLRDTMLAVLRQREVRRCLFAAPLRHASLALAACRIWAAYATGALRYVIFTAEKRPATDGMIAGNRGGSARG